MNIFIVFIGLLIFCAYVYCNSSSYIGKRGEEKVAGILNRLPSDEYITINNVLCQKRRKSTQIDHVVVSPYGIFVIETKNYTGWILGGENSDQWIKNMYGHKYYFYNPIKQNKTHISELQKVLNLPADDFISIIAFSKDAEIKVHTSQNVVNFKKIPSIILSYSQIKFTSQEVLQIATRIQVLKSDEKEQVKKHTRFVKRHLIFVKRRAAYAEKAVRKRICPKCGGELVKRRGAYGKFLGCSNFPKCKYTHPL